MAGLMGKDQNNFIIKEHDPLDDSGFAWDSWNAGESNILQEIHFGSPFDTARVLSINDTSTSAFFILHH